MIVVFLDIDGVLVTTRSKPFDAADSDFDAGWFSKENMESFKSIIEGSAALACAAATDEKESTQVGIILCTSWRRHPEGIEAIRTAMAQCDIRAPIFGSTPEKTTAGCTRGAQISAVFSSASSGTSTHNTTPTMDVTVNDITGALILDDWPVGRNYLGSDKPVLEAHHVRSDQSRGLQGSDVTKALSIVEADVKKGLKTSMLMCPLMI